MPRSKFCTNFVLSGCGSRWTISDRIARSWCRISSRLELEITEAVLIRDDDAALEILHQLRAIGVRIALDDFRSDSTKLVQNFEPAGAGDHRGGSDSRRRCRARNSAPTSCYRGADRAGRFQIG